MFSKSFRAILVCTLLAAVLLLAGCRLHTSIAEINKDPGSFTGKDVSVRGKVSGSFSALGNGVFQVDDGTGQIWVYSQNFGVPGNDQTISVTGRVEQGLNVAGHSYGVVLRQTEAR